jgi:hypothetical protein
MLMALQPNRATSSHLFTESTPYALDVDPRSHVKYCNFTTITEMVEDFIGGSFQSWDHSRPITRHPFPGSPNCLQRYNIEYEEGLPVDNDPGEHIARSPMTSYSQLPTVPTKVPPNLKRFDLCQAEFPNTLPASFCNELIGTEEPGAIALSKHPCNGDSMLQNTIAPFDPIPPILNERIIRSLNHMMPESFEDTLANATFPGHFQFGDVPGGNTILAYSNCIPTTSDYDDESYSALRSSASQESSPDLNDLLFYPSFQTFTATSSSFFSGSDTPGTSYSLFSDYDSTGNDSSLSSPLDSEVLRNPYPPFVGIARDCTGTHCGGTPNPSDDSTASESSLSSPFDSEIRRFRHPLYVGKNTDCTGIHCGGTPSPSYVNPDRNRNFFVRCQTGSSSSIASIEGYSDSQPCFYTHVSGFSSSDDGIVG